LQRSPIKETVFCKRDIFAKETYIDIFTCEACTHVHIRDMTHDLFCKTHSSYIYIHDVTQWVTSRIIESRHVFICMTYNESGTNVYIHDVTHDSFGKTYSSCIYIHDVTQWVTSRINEPRDAWMSHVTYERVTSYIHMHDVEWVLHTCMNESCDIWMSRVSYKRVCTHMSESYPTDPQHTATQWVTSRMNGSVTWLVQTRLYETWLIYMWHDSFIHKMTQSYVTWLVYMWHDSFICDMTRLYVTWLIHMWHDSCTLIDTKHATLQHTTSHIWVSHILQIMSHI